MSEKWPRRPRYVTVQEPSKEAGVVTTVATADLMGLSILPNITLPSNAQTLYVVAAFSEIWLARDPE
jgi:hypothetical protein